MHRSLFRIQKLWVITRDSRDTWVITRDYTCSGIRYNFIISLKSYILSHKKVEERLADSVEVSTIVVNMIFERNTPKLNLTLYVPILILLALFLGSILIPSKLPHYEKKALII